MRLFLDDHQGAVLAYSYRKLRASYTGAAIRIRRDNDNAETDIGFVNGELDRSAVDAFLPTGLGVNVIAFIVRYYDQTGNGNDATQANAIRQPLVAFRNTSNVLVFYGITGIGNPNGAYFNSSRSLNLPSVYSQSGGFATLYHFKASPNVSSSQVLFNLGNSSQATSHHVSRVTAGKIETGHFSTGGVTEVESYGGLGNYGQYAISDYLQPSASDSHLYINNTNYTGAASPVFSYSKNVLGSRDGTSYFTDGAINAFILYDTDKYSDAIAMNAYLRGLIPQTWYLLVDELPAGNPILQDAAITEISAINLDGNDITTGGADVEASTLSTFATPVAPITILDKLPSGAHSAYGLDQLNPSYTGPAIRAYRMSDGAELDIGFDLFGRFDSALAASFCGTSELRAKKMYDQTGNGNDLSQSTWFQMPKIWNSLGSAADAHEISGRTGAFFHDAFFLPSNIYTPSGFSILTEVRPFTNQDSVFINLFNGSDAMTLGFNVGGFYNTFSRHGATSKSSGPHTIGKFITLTDFKQTAGFASYNDGASLAGSLTGTSATPANIIGAGDFFNNRNGTSYVYALIFYQSDEGSNATSINSELDLFFNGYNFYGSGLTAQAEVNTATLTEVVNIGANGITTANPIVGTTTIGFIYNLSANPINTPNPVLGQPYLYAAVVNPVAPQTNIIVNGKKLHIFPDYKIGLSLNYSAGSIEGLEASISDQFELPFDDYNANILGVNLGSLSAGQRFDCQIEDEASNTIYEGHLEVISATIQALYKSIEVRFVDKVKTFVNTLKDTKLHELISTSEFDHDFQLAKPADSFTGVESLISSSDLVRYVYTDYNGIDNFNVLALHRDYEEFAGGDGIQQLQPAFKVNEFINRIETLTGETVNSKFFSNLISGVDTDKLYFQFPMRYHGFNEALRDDRIRLKFQNRMMYAGFPEQELPYMQSIDPINYRVRNRATNVKALMQSLNNNFQIFMQDAVVAPQDFLAGALAEAGADSSSLSSTYLNYYQQIANLFKGLKVLRTGTYKLEGTVNLPELNLVYVDPNPNQNGLRLQGIQGFTGDVVLNIGVIINGLPPKLIPLKTYNHTDFSTTSSTSTTTGGQTYYNFLRANQDSATYESDDLELRMGDVVEYCLVLTGEGESFSVGRNGTLIQGISVFDMSNTSGYSNLGFTFGTGVNALPAPFANINASTLDSYSAASQMNHIPNMKASKEYPLCGIPQKRLYTNPTAPAEYEAVDFKENVKRFADVSVYDILMDIMGRFNMSAWYNHSNGEFYFDNFAEQYVRLATAENIKPNFDDKAPLDIDLQKKAIRSITLSNEKGDSESDKVLEDITIGDYPEAVLDAEAEEEVSYSSMFALANGKNFGTPYELTLNLSSTEKFLRFIPKNDNLQVQDYGLRIGFVSSGAKKVTVATPHVANFFIPQPVNVHPFTRYKARQNSAFFLPTFQQLDDVNNFTLEFAVEESGVMNPEPSTTATAYEVFWKWYVENMFGGVGFAGDFVFNKADIKSISPLKTYDFGFGDCIIEDIDSFDLTEERDKVKVKLRKI